MRYMFQFLIIGFITFIGEMMNYYIPLPVPGSVYGLVLLFILLCFKVINLNQVQDTGEFLIAIMPIMFIPAGVGLITCYDIIADNLLPLMLATVVVTAIVMGVTGLIAEIMMKKVGGKNE